jgi:hypothetical protein
MVAAPTVRRVGAHQPALAPLEGARHIAGRVFVPWAHGDGARVLLPAEPLRRAAAQVAAGRHAAVRLEQQQQR